MIHIPTDVLQLDQAIAEGRHSAHWQGVVCTQCREFRPQWWSNEAGLPFCRQCAPRTRFDPVEVQQ